MMMGKSLMAVCCLFAALFVHAVEITSDGKPSAEVILPERESRQLTFAAQELQLWIKNISGAELPIYHAPSLRKNTKIFLGRDFLKNQDALDSAGKFDSWIIRSEGRSIYLAARNDNGVINAVFDLLEKNTDLIFARPDTEYGTVFTPDKNLDFKITESSGKISFGQREFGLVSHHFEPNTHAWARRNYSNSRGMFFQKYHIYSSTGFFFDTGLQYEFGPLLPNDKYFAGHPEYFAWKEGKRKPYEHYGPQLCYTSEEGLQALLRELHIKLAKDITPDVKYIGFGFGDTWDLCCCEKCRKPIRLPDGTEISEDNEAFRSTQYYIYLNKIAESVTAKYPQMEIRTLGYIYAAVPPKIRLHPKIQITYCPYPKTFKFNINHPQNKKWGDRSRDWAAVSDRIGIYEYYGDASDFCRPIADTAAEDMRIWNKLGINYFITMETYPDYRLKDQKEDKLAGAWDVAAVEYWVLARLFVDSSQDPQKLRERYFKLAYREAAEPMKAYYAAIRKSWHSTDAWSSWNDDAVYQANIYIRKTGQEQSLRALLEEAEKKAVHPSSKMMIQKHRARFEYWMQQISKLEPEDQKIPMILNSSSAGNDFSDKAWKNAAHLTEFNLTGKPNAATSFKTVADVFHDRMNLYVRFHCEEPGLNTALSSKTEEKERFPSGSSVGLFIKTAEGEKYYHFAVNVNGQKYDAEGYNSKWNAERFNAIVKSNGDSWDAIMVIPLEKLGFTISLNNKLKLLPVRSATGNDTAKKEESSLFGRRPHTPGNFPAMLMTE